MVTVFVNFLKSILKRINNSPIQLIVLQLLPSTIQIQSVVHDKFHLLLIVEFVVIFVLVLLLKIDFFEEALTMSDVNSPFFVPILLYFVLLPILLNNLVIVALAEYILESTVDFFHMFHLFDKILLHFEHLLSLISISFDFLIIAYHYTIVGFALVILTLHSFETFLSDKNCELLE